MAGTASPTPAPRVTISNITDALGARNKRLMDIALRVESLADLACGSRPGGDAQGERPKPDGSIETVSAEVFALDLPIDRIDAALIRLGAQIA